MHIYHMLLLFYMYMYVCLCVVCVEGGSVCVVCLVGGWVCVVCVMGVCGWVGVLPACVCTRVSRIFRDAARRIAQVIQDARLPIDPEEYVNSFKPQLMEAVLAWCQVPSDLAVGCWLANDRNIS